MFLSSVVGVVARRRSSSTGILKKILHANLQLSTSSSLFYLLLKEQTFQFSHLQIRIEIKIAELVAT